MERTFTALDVAIVASLIAIAHDVSDSIDDPAGKMPHDCIDDAIRLLRMCDQALDQSRKDAAGGMDAPLETPAAEATT